MRKLMHRIVLLAAALGLLCVPAPAMASDRAVEMYRMYNPNSGEHFYTANAGERDALSMSWWVYEGVGWIAPETSDVPVYRLYNRYAGDHHYTTSAGERDYLVSQGWTYEGIGWYSDDLCTLPLLRQYNPYAVAGTHNYTTKQAENDALVNAGWIEEGVAWYALSPGRDPYPGEVPIPQPPVPEPTPTPSPSDGGGSSSDEPAGTIYYWSRTGDVWHNHRCRTVARYESSMRSGSYSDMVAAGVAGRRQCKNCAQMD